MIRRYRALGFFKILLLISKIFLVADSVKCVAVGASHLGVGGRAHQGVAISIPGYPHLMRTTFIPFMDGHLVMSRFGEYGDQRSQRTGSLFSQQGRANESPERANGDPSNTPHANRIHGHMPRGDKRRIHRRRNSTPLMPGDENILGARDPKKAKMELVKYKKLLSDIKTWGESEDEEKKDLSEFILENIKDYPMDQPSEDLTPQDVLEMLSEQFADEDEREFEWQKHVERVHDEIIGEVESLNLTPVSSDVSKTNLETLAYDDKCGFKFPITGSPEEIYSDPNIYKAWGRTLLHHVQYTNTTRTTFGPYNDTHLDLEDMMISTSPLVDKSEIGRQLEKIHHANFGNTLNDALNGMPSGSTHPDEHKPIHPDKYRYRYASVGNRYRVLRQDILAAKAERQREILKILNPYNPWDEYVKLKRTRGDALNDTIGVNYKVEISENIAVGVGMNAMHNELNISPELNIPSDFISDYLHYFLILDQDKKMVQEFKDATFVQDILKYFDTFVKYKEPPKEEFKDAQDRFFNMLFPSMDVFPKKPDETHFPVTLTPGEASNFRINVASALVALERCHSLIGVYESDIFSEQRFSNILNILHSGLELELKRMEYGIVEMELLDVDAEEFCKVDGAFLAALSATLGVLNIRSRIEGIIELIILLTLKTMHCMSSEHLVTILFNVANLCTLPRSILSKFISKVTAFIHDKIKEDIITKDGETPWMDYEVSTHFIDLLTNYQDIMSAELISNYVHLYKMDVMMALKRGMDVDRMDDHRGADRMDDHRDVDRMRRAHGVCSLLVAIERCGLSDEFAPLINALSVDFYFQHLEFTSISAVAVLSSMNDSDELQSHIIQRARSRLVELKYKMGATQILDVLDVYIRAMEEGRIKRESIFITSLMQYFMMQKRPNAQEWVRAAEMVERFIPFLSKQSISAIFDDLTDDPFTIDHGHRLGLSGEKLKFSFIDMSKVLKAAARCKVPVTNAWKMFYTLITFFKHTIMVDDILEILDALQVGNFANVDPICEMLMDRICNIVEVKEDVEYDGVFRAMEECMKLGYAPTRLLRWLMYTSIYDIDKMDRDAVADELLGKKMEYDVDFRGWKRPVTTDEHVENIALHRNLFLPVEMRGSRVKSSEALKYSLPQYPHEPRPVLSHVLRDGMDGRVRDGIARIMGLMDDAGFVLEERDAKLAEEWRLSSQRVNVEHE